MSDDEKHFSTFKFKFVTFNIFLFTTPDLIFIKKKILKQKSYDIIKRRRKLTFL